MSKEIYFSVDIEADGPIPGPHSMLSLGAVAIDADGNERDTFTVNLQELEGAAAEPSTAKWWSEQPAEVYAAARSNPRDPVSAMTAFKNWVETLARSLDAKPVFVGYPAGYDFTFVYWYLVKFAGGSPFSFSAIDMKTLGMVILECNYRDVGKRALKAFLPPNVPHTHVALDDAREQGQLFINMLRAARWFVRTARLDKSQ